MEDTKRLLAWVRSVQEHMNRLQAEFLQAQDLLAWIPAPAESVKEALAARLTSCVQTLVGLEALLRGDPAGPPDCALRPMDAALIEMERREEELQQQRRRTHTLRERVLALTRELLDRDMQRADAQVSPKEQLIALPE